jgi:hypothetical protein
MSLVAGCRCNSNGKLQGRDLQLQLAVKIQPRSKTPRRFMHSDKQSPSTRQEITLSRCRLGCLRQPLFPSLRGLTSARVRESGCLTPAEPFLTDLDLGNVLRKAMSSTSTDLARLGMLGLARHPTPSTRHPTPQTARVMPARFVSQMTWASSIPSPTVAFLPGSLPAIRNTVVPSLYSVASFMCRVALSSHCGRFATRARWRILRPTFPTKNRCFIAPIPQMAAWPATTARRNLKSTMTTPSSARVTLQVGLWRMLFFRKPPFWAAIWAGAAHTS